MAIPPQDEAGRRYGGSSAQERRQLRYEQFLDAALDCFSEQGLPGVGVRPVSAKAGIAPRYFRESFADRDALLVALYDKAAAQVLRVALDVLSTDRGDQAARVRASLDAVLHALDSDPRLAPLLFGTAIEPVLRERRERMLLDYADAITAQAVAIFPDDIEPAAFRVTSVILSGGYIELITWWLADRSRASRDELLDRATGIFFAAATPAGHASPR
ncbi:TetR/AcrR family transcriptional regulator [Nocardia jejuensis]|uniref:TetR/AcrR family transcriptional regulator n=1 Tax=Nocardia jejuensis TaxID=328049 RepID=UPI00082CBB83|nr:TetR/AcrR family transcriptional regulator [Nocardia jejuensis]